MRVYFPGLTNTTTSVIKAEQRKNNTLLVIADGTGTVELEFQRPDGVFRSFADSTFSVPFIKEVLVPSGEFRVKVTGGAANVEIQG